MATGLKLDSWKFSTRQLAPPVSTVRSPWFGFLGPSQFMCLFIPEGQIEESLPAHVESSSWCVGLSLFTFCHSGLEEVRGTYAHQTTYSFASRC